MSPAGFEPAIPANERRQTHALDRYWDQLLCYLHDQYVLVQQYKASCDNKDMIPNFLNDSSKITAFYLLASAPLQTFTCSA